MRNHRICLEAYARWWRAHRPSREPTTTTSSDLAAFLVDEAERGLSARTGRAEISALRRVFAWLVPTRAVEASPAAALVTPGPEQDALSWWRPAPARPVGTTRTSGARRRDQNWSGVDLHVVQRLLGHSSISSTVG